MKREGCQTPVPSAGGDPSDPPTDRTGAGLPHPLAESRGPDREVRPPNLPAKAARVMQRPRRRVAGSTNSRLQEKEQHDENQGQT